MSTNANTSLKLTAISGTTVVLVMTASHFVNDNFTSLLTPLQPDIARAFNVTKVETGALVSLLALVGSVLQPMFGGLGDRFDRRYLAAAGPMLSALGMTLMGLAPNLWLMGFFVVLGGIGSAVFHPSGAAFVASNSQLERRGLYASIFSAGGTAGLSLGPLTAGALGLHGIIYLLPIGILMGVISFVLTPSTQSSSNNVRSLQDYLAVFQGPIRLLWAVSVLRSLSTVTYQSLIPYVFDSSNLKHHIGWTLFTFSIASAAGGIVGGLLSDRLGRTKVLRSSVLGLIPLFILLVLSNPDQFWFYPLAFVVGGLANATIPVAVVAAQEFAPGHTGTTSALMMGFSWGTAGVLYLAFAALANATSPSLAMIVSIVLLVPGFFLTLKIPEPPRAILK
jgi:FSR family fosmidomycin resistance protein-like MFS transporter